MDIERNSKQSSKSQLALLNESGSQRSSLLSIARLSSKRASLSNKVSLIDAMDLQRSTTSNFHPIDDIMIDQNIKRFSDFRRSDKSREYQFNADIFEKDLLRKSNCQIKHQCKCQQNECNQRHCICYLTPLQICIIGICCPKCIQSKNQFLKATRGYQLQWQKQQKYKNSQQRNLEQLLKQTNSKNMHYIKQVCSKQTWANQIKFCTCKNSQCQKKYCNCFNQGIKCGQYCSCLDCQNKDTQDDFSKYQDQKRWERNANYITNDQPKDIKPMDQDIEQYFDQTIQLQQNYFNQTMQFEPVNFDKYLENMYM